MHKFYVALVCFTLQIGIIGGSGMDDPDILEKRQEKCVSTPYGEVCLSNVNDIYSPYCDVRLKIVSIAGSRDGAVVRALASHQCGPGLITGPGVICGLSLLLVLVFAPRCFSLGTPVFPSPQKPTLQNSNSIWIVSPISAPR